jgi:hypothetical protein
MFNYGRKHYSDLASRFQFDDQELNTMWNMYKKKYWGNVDNETWEKNNQAAKEERGEIMAVYVAANGTNIVFARVKHGNYTFVMLQEDIDNGWYEKMVVQVDPERSMASLRKKTFSDMIRELETHRIISGNSIYNPSFDVGARSPKVNYSVQGHAEAVERTNEQETRSRNR